MKKITRNELTNLLGNFKYVENKDAVNQFILHYENGTIFQSYSSLIGAKINGRLYLTSYHDYSNTTSKHCGRWCGYNTKERRAGLIDGTITYIE